MSVTWAELVSRVTKDLKDVSPESDKCYTQEIVKNVLHKTINRIEELAEQGVSVRIANFGEFAGDIQRPIAKGFMTRGRIVVSFRHFDSRSKELWDRSVFSEVFEGEKK